MSPSLVLVYRFFLHSHIEFFFLRQVQVELNALIQTALSFIADNHTILFTWLSSVVCIGSLTYHSSVLKRAWRRWFSDSTVVIIRSERIQLCSDHSRTGQHPAGVLQEEEYLLRIIGLATFKSNGDTTFGREGKHHWMGMARGWVTEERYRHWHASQCNEGPVSRFHCKVESH
jgi:hypothetical protein